jgi:tRNA-splicing ligase RtcB
MATPAYIVRGKGNPESLESASHGAGRVMSRAAAKKAYRWSDANALLARNKVKVLSAGIDELPMVYKDIDAVMKAQQDLVGVVARFQPRLVKMAPAGEQPED